MPVNISSCEIIGNRKDSSPPTQTTRRSAVADPKAAGTRTTLLPRYPYEIKGQDSVIKHNERYPIQVMRQASVGEPEPTKVTTKGDQVSFPKICVCCARASDAVTEVYDRRYLGSSGGKIRYE